MGFLKKHELLYNEIIQWVGSVILLSVQNNAKQYKSPAINVTFLKLTFLLNLCQRGVDLTLVVFQAFVGGKSLCL